MKKKYLKYAGVGILGALLVFALAHAEDFKNEINYCKSIKDEVLLEKQIMTREELEQTVSKLNRCTLILPFICQINLMLQTSSETYSNNIDLYNTNG